MHDANGVRRMDRVRDLLHDRAHLVGGQRPLSLGVLLEDLAGSPLDGEEVESGAGFTDLDRPNHVRVLHALAVSSFAKKPRDRSAVLPQFIAQDLYGNDAVIRMLCAENGGRSAFTDFALKRISRNGLTDKALSWHAANLTAANRRGKRKARTHRACEEKIECEIRREKFG